MAFTQAERFIAIHTTLGKDKLLLSAFAGQESLSQPFDFNLDLLSEDPDIDLSAILGKPASIEVKMADGKSSRFFHGIVDWFSQIEGVGSLSRYQARLVPQVHQLARIVDSEIFLERSVPQIAQELLKKAAVPNKNGKGFSEGKYRKREFTVMYRESALNCLMRLLEEEGIFYYFQHESAVGGKDVLVFADSAEGCEMLAPNEIDFDRSGGNYRIGAKDRVLAWRREMRAIVQQYGMRDYNFEMPSNKLEVSVDAQATQGAKGVVRTYPGTYTKSSEGDWYARVQSEQEESERDVVRGRGILRSFSPGYRFKLKRHPRSDQNDEYQITSVYHAANSNFLEESGGASYQTEFVCIPSSIQYRPPRITRKPLVEGVQTARVVGASGNEIDADKYGRVKVQFHWDRRDLENEKSSCPVRVGTPIAGNNWGMVHVPRIGQEVIVQFLEGDPDRPIIVGSVYNAEQMPPYSLPANQTQSGIKSRSSKGGGPDNFNELRFEDKKGSEEIYFHAEKDFKRVVEKDDTLEIGKDQTETIESNRTVTLKQGNDKTIVEMGNVTLNIQKGNQKIAIDLGKSEMEAMQSIEMKVGQSSIKLDQAGVTIKGMTIKIEAQIMAEVKAVMTNVKADAMLTAKGALVMVN